jgi:hypothetical protein
MTQNSGTPTPGSFTWADQVNTPISSMAATSIVFHTASYMPAFMGVYSVNLQYTWSGPTVVIRTFTFTVTDPCASAVTPPASIPAYSAYLGDPNYTQAIGPTISLAYQASCVYSISLSSLKDSLPDTTSTLTYVN